MSGKLSIDRRAARRRRVHARGRGVPLAPFRQQPLATERLGHRRRSTTRGDVAFFFQFVAPRRRRRADRGVDRSLLRPGAGVRGGGHIAILVIGWISGAQPTTRSTSIRRRRRRSPKSCSSRRRSPSRRRSRSRARCARKTRRSARARRKARSATTTRRSPRRRFPRATRIRSSRRCRTWACSASSRRRSSRRR